MTACSSAADERADDLDVELAGIDCVLGHPPTQLSHLLQHAANGRRRVTKLRQPGTIALDVRAEPPWPPPGTCHGHHLLSEGGCAPLRRLRFPELCRRIARRYGAGHRNE